MASRQVDFVRVKEKPIPAGADTSTVERGKRLLHVPVPISYENRTAPSEIQVPLTRDEIKQLAALKTASKAIVIVKKHLREKYSGRNIEIREDVIGADIQVVFKDGDEEDKLIEVKGTGSNDVAWGQLFVSGQPSHDNLSKGIPLYRVIDVNSKTPRILVLKCGQDFIMEPEVRWKVKRAPR